MVTGQQFQLTKDEALRPDFSKDCITLQLDDGTIDLNVAHIVSFTCQEVTEEQFKAMQEKAKEKPEEVKVA